MQMMGGMPAVADAAIDAVAVAAGAVLAAEATALYFD